MTDTRTHPMVSLFQQTILGCVPLSVSVFASGTVRAGNCKSVAFTACRMVTRGSGVTWLKLKSKCHRAGSSWRLCCLHLMSWALPLGPLDAHAVSVDWHLFPSLSLDSRIPWRPSE